MFILDENQQHHLVVILNEINRHIYECTLQQQQLHSKNNKNVQKNNIQHHQRKTIELPSPITGFNFTNRQSLIDFILNSIRYFQTFFKHTSNGQESQSRRHHSKWIVFWLSIFYSKNLFEHIDFEQIFDDDDDDDSVTYRNDKNKDICAKSKVILNGATSSTTTSNNLLEKTSSVTNLKDTHNAAIHVDELVSRMNVLHELNLPASNHPMYQQTLTNLNNELTNSNTAVAQQSNLQLSQLQTSFQQLQNIPQLPDPKLGPKDNNVDMYSLEQQNSLNYQTIKDITFVSLLLTVIFYKLRYVFSNLVSSPSWKFLISFERELESSFLHDSFSEFLQNELSQQRYTNKKRTDHLRKEVSFLEKLTKTMAKEVENEIYRFVQLQCKPTANNNNNNNKALAPVLNRISNNQEHQPQQVTLSMNTNDSTSTNKIATREVGGSNTKCCPECGKVFKNTYKLNRHLYVHKDPSEKPFMCNWERCNYRSISKNDLNRHRMVHTGEKPYICEVDGCEKRYSRADKLRHHKLVVHFKDINKKELVCIWPGCNFQCLAKNELNRHQLTHEAIKCDYIGCDKIFDKVDKFKKHKEKDHLVKVEVTLGEFSGSNFNAVAGGVPISVTSTPDIATVAAASNHQQTQHSALQQQMQQQHVMLANNVVAAAAMHHGMTGTTTNEHDNNKMNDHHHIQSHMSLANVVSLEAATDNNHNNSNNNNHQMAANNNAQNNANNANNQVVINTISSVPISVVASNTTNNNSNTNNNNNNNNSNHHPNTISVWSS